MGKNSPLTKNQYLSMFYVTFRERERERCYIELLCAFPAHTVPCTQQTQFLLVTDKTCRPMSENSRMWLAEYSTVGSCLIQGRIVEKSEGKRKAYLSSALHRPGTVSHNLCVRVHFPVHNNPTAGCKNNA